MTSYFRGIDTYIEHWRRGVFAKTVDIMDDIGKQGADRVREIILLKETNWGRERQAGLHGPPRPHAGRYEEGDMYNDVDSRTPDVDVGEITVAWGWQNPKHYYMLQEEGTDKIEPMHSLRDSLDEAENELHRRLRDL